MGLLWLVIIGAIAGWLAGQFMRGDGFGLFGDIVVGVIGAFLGGYLFRLTGVAVGGGLIGSLIVAFIGSVRWRSSSSSASSPAAAGAESGLERAKPVGTAADVDHGDHACVSIMNMRRGLPVPAISA